jgi:hypothetical protein
MCHSASNKWRVLGVASNSVLSPILIGHHDIQLASSGLLIEPSNMKTQTSAQINSKGSILVRSKESFERETHPAIDDCWVTSTLPISGKPDRRLNALLDILFGYEASLHD